MWEMPLFYSWEVPCFTCDTSKISLQLTAIHCATKVMNDEWQDTFLCAFFLLLLFFKLSRLAGYLQSLQKD